MKKLLTLSNKELIKIIENLVENIVIDPAYKIYSKSFAIEYLRKNLEVYKRYKKVKLSLLVFPFNPKAITELKDGLRSSDVIAKFDDAILIILNDTSKNGAFKVRNRLNKFFDKGGEIIEVNTSNTLADIIKKVNRIMYSFH